MIRSHLKFANVASALALCVALSGTSYAAVKITGKDVKNSSLTGKDVKDSSLRSGDFAPGQLPAGAPGPKGDKGEPATSLWAVINQNGTIARHRGATANTLKEATGTYNVHFDRDVSSCAYSVTIGGADAGTPPAGSAGATNLADVNNALYIRTYNAAGALADQGFHVAVLC